MIQSKEYIIHQIANDIKTHIGQKYKNKSNIDWGLYTGLFGKTLFSLPPFERAVVCIKHFEGLLSWKDYPYVGYGHRLLPGERFSAAMTERRADSLLRADLMKRLMMFKDYERDALLLAVLSYNIGAGRLLGYGKHPKSRLLRKIESGDRNFYHEFVSFCRYKGKVLRGLVKRRKVEFALFYIP